MNAENDQDGLVAGINVTPLVDIMLVLLIIFMVTAHFIQNTGLKINLPKMATTEAAPTAALTVSVDNKGALHLMENVVDAATLKQSLAREASRNPGVRVTLAADEDLPYRTVVTTLDLIKSAGVTRVALAGER